MTSTPPKAAIGIIGGSGLYQMDALKNIEEYSLETPYGTPSEVLVSGTIDDIAVVFLARHGRGHRLIPSEVPYRANIYALKMCGVKYLLSISAVGSLQEELAPRDMVIPDQFIDLTKSRQSTFFGQGAVAHVSMAEPVCPTLAEVLAEAVAALPAEQAVTCHRGGSYVCIEGPQFSSLAESHWYRSMGASVIGMTNMPEAKLALEAQIAYASLAMVTDYDCWHPKEDNVSADMALANLFENAGKAQKIVAEVVQRLGSQMPVSAAHQALTKALVTPFEQMSEATRARLQLLAT
ncbi:S-methyl-5'-thioadenosine phosphorylase [Halioxenophilus sp. WMMB6]|uniref:S-methyl-5'-thioadenosine phosphorylase n=1 Tax=Halioxenophilus sp. WMMB6 TaxID=3073815 RepID=UPI00295F18D5|nr:S-methyl-5'-thioadenosine phosphorylase [Halioxenophilus sp. WMMB6]